MRIRGMLAILAAASLTAGCHLMRPTCGGVEDYQAAQAVPRLQVPNAMAAPDAADALRIPPAAPGAAPPPSPRNACLEKPPKYRDNPPGVEAGHG